MHPHYDITVLSHMTIPFTIHLVTKEPIDPNLKTDTIRQIDTFLARINRDYSAYDPTSLVNHHPASGQGVSDFFIQNTEYQAIFAQCLLVKEKSEGLFDPFYNGNYDPTGLVKGWAIEEAFFRYIQPLLDANLLIAGSINGGGDMQVGVQKGSDFRWTIGIEHPIKKTIVATYELKNGALATSGNTKRGMHIQTKRDTTQQVTILAPYLSLADCWATVGVAADESQFQHLIRKEALTGLTYLDDQHSYHYQQGVITYDSQPSLSRQ